jgi:hypothetical protein
VLVSNFGFRIYWSQKKGCLSNTPGLQITFCTYVINTREERILARGKTFKKCLKRDQEKRKILLELGLKKIEEKEKEDFIPLGYRGRGVKFSPPFFEDEGSIPHPQSTPA